MMTFIELLALVQAAATAGKGINICADSGRVCQGDVFVAVIGDNADGHDYIPEAVANGAKYVVSQRSCKCDGAEVVVVGNSRSALGRLAQVCFGSPASKLTNLAVTGTNGKTTVGFLVRSVIESSGARCGLIGTIVYDTGEGKSQRASLTTPDAVQIARLGHEMCQAGTEFAMIEASSHALSQDRLSGVDFTAAAFTNLSGDHLDYHKTERKYLAAKTKLFEQMPIHSAAILNKQCEVCREIAKKTRARILWYAIDEPADIVAHIESMDMHQTIYALQFNGCKDVVKTSLIGRHNVSNHLAAAGLCFAVGFGLSQVAIGLSDLDVVPGRLDSVECGQNFKVLIDYAHTDDAMKNVLATLRPLCTGELIVVFGCGGDRDKTKRPRMGRAAEDMADRLFVTSDNPRTEEPVDIIDDIVAGFSEKGSKRIVVEPDRRRAIELAIRSAGKNDIVLIAGKGHEDYQIIGAEKIHFDDREVAAKVLGDIL